MKSTRLVNVQVPGSFSLQDSISPPADIEWIGRGRPQPPPPREPPHRRLGQGSRPPAQLPAGAQSNTDLSACRDGAPRASLGTEKHIKPRSPLPQFKTAPSCPIADSLTVLLFSSEEQLFPNASAQRASKAEQLSPPRPPRCAGWCCRAGPGGRRAGLDFRPSGRARACFPAARRRYSGTGRATAESGARGAAG